MSLYFPRSLGPSYLYTSGPNPPAGPYQYQTLSMIYSDSGQQRIARDGLNLDHPYEISAQSKKKSF